MRRDEARTQIDDDEPIWYPSVKSPTELPALAEPGARCRVMGENAIYVYVDGKWRASSAKPTL